MVGPQRSVPSTSTARDNSTAIPRPPNAWILFRAVKQKELLESRGKEPQAEVSKMISQMWKDAPEDVRAHYERLAEEKKAEHKVQYPGYRFQPKKKEEKEKLRQQKKLDKQRQASSSSAPTNPLPAVPVVPMIPPQVPGQPLLQPNPILGNADMYYSLYTPRVSAEPSPSPPVYSNLSRHVSAGAYTNGHSNESSFDSNDWQLTQATSTSQQLLTPDSAITPLTGNNWHDVQSTEQSTLNAQDSQISESIKFEVPATALPQDFDDYLSLSSTQTQYEVALRDSLVFAFNYQLDDSPPVDSALQVSLHNQLPNWPTNLYGDFDFTGLDLQYSSANEEGVLSSEMLYPLDSIGPIVSNNDFNDFDQFVNFYDYDSSTPENAGPGVTSLITPPPEAQPQAVQSNIPSSTSGYVPPSGASSSSKRRVAATWKTAGLVGTDSPVNNSPPRVFGVSAT